MTDATKCGAELRLDDNDELETHHFACELEAGHPGDHQHVFECLGQTEARLVWPREALIGTMHPGSGL